MVTQVSWRIVAVQIFSDTKKLQIAVFKVYVAYKVLFIDYWHIHNSVIL